MDFENAIRWIGFTHLLQPPLTLLLAEQLGLRRSFERLPPVAFRVAQNMAVAAVALPTSLGVFLAVNAADAVHHGPTWFVALGVAVFWTWRLERQLRALGPLFDGRHRFWHPVLTSIFVLQGPVLALLVMWVRFGGAR